MISELQRNTDPWQEGVPYAKWMVRYGHHPATPEETKAWVEKIEREKERTSRTRKKKTGSDGELFDNGKNELSETGA